MEKQKSVEEDSKEKIKTSFSKQRAKDLTEHARAILMKEQEIERLKQDSPRVEVKMNIDCLFLILRG